MSKLKIKLFVAKNKLWIYPIFCIICIGVFFSIASNSKIDFIQKVTNCSGEVIAVIGTLLGAVVGAIFTFMGSIYVNKRQLQAQTHIKRKNIIYKPLYDELCNIQNNILLDNPYPAMISFQTLDRTSHIIPQYTVWGRIKSDTRYLETPSNLVAEMEVLYDRINEYIKVRNGNNDEMTELINGILHEVLGTTCSITNIGDCIIRYALIESEDHVIRYDYELKDKVDVTEEQKALVDKLFYEKCCTNQTIQRIKWEKLAWEKQQKKVISLLTDLIQLVNIKYEG